jgi:hypothetical protein
MSNMKSESTSVPINFWYCGEHWQVWQDMTCNSVIHYASVTLQSPPPPPKIKTKSNITLLYTDTTVIWLLNLTQTNQIAIIPCKVQQKLTAFNFSRRQDRLRKKKTYAQMEDVRPRAFLHKPMLLPRRAMSQSAVPSSSFQSQNRCRWLQPSIRLHQC